MKLTASLKRHCAWVNLSTTTLIALLQRTPVLRVAAAAEEYVASSPIGTILKSAAVAAAALGTVDSMAGATILADTLNANPSGNLPTFDATVGTPISPLAFTITNTMNIGSWTITGQIPPGLVLTTLEPNGGTLTAPGNLDATTPGSAGNGWSGGTAGNATTTPILKGTPTTAGSYTFNLQGFALGGEMGGNGGTFVGTVVSAVFPFTVVVSAATVLDSGARLHDTADIGDRDGRHRRPQRRGVKRGLVPVDVERHDAGPRGDELDAAPEQRRRLDRQLHLRRDQRDRQRDQQPRRGERGEHKQPRPPDQPVR